MLGSASAALALLRNQPVMAAAAEEDRYRVAVTQANGLLEDIGGIKGLCKEWYGTPEYAAWVGRATDSIRYILDHFPEEPDQESVNALFEKKLDFSVKHEDEARRLLPGMLPVAMMYTQIITHKLPFNMSKQDAFAEWAVRYRPFIMA